MRHLHNDAKSVLGVVLTAVLACATAPAWGQLYGSIAFSPKLSATNGTVAHELSALAGMGQ